ncbi:MAG: hypothetical protein H0X65_03660 [Gemmatimonadetes bacterium]|nr:hypothetical protein [Gemmatimonadota bacterium]
MLWGLPVEHHLRVEQGLLWTFGRVLRLPPIQKLITWIRLLHAAHLLQDLARSIENVTLRKEFACVNSFRNQLQRYAGMSPSHLRVRGGFQYLLNKFRARCAGVQDRGTR